MGSFLVSPRLAHVREAPAGTWLNLAWVVATELQFIDWALLGQFIREILVETVVIHARCCFRLYRQGTGQAKSSSLKVLLFRWGRWTSK